MKILLSPAKSLDLTTPIPTDLSTEILFKKEAESISEVLKQLSVKDLEKLMHISTKLAELNWERNQQRDLNEIAKLRQAVYMFDGDVYSGLNIYSLPLQHLDKLQNRIRILSGLYGILRPLDAIAPYRLEMGTSLAINEHANLYQFWKELITNSLNEETKEHELIVNLASNEYFNAVNTKKLKGNLVTPEFKDYKNDQLKTISFFAKKARGLMARYLIENDITDIDGMKFFNEEGYRYDENLSTSNKLIFTR